MFEIILRRVVEGEDGIYGVLIHDNHPICVTLERRWLDNEPNVSCVPSGKYKCIKYNSDKFPDVWQLLDVPGRSNILIHTGNLWLDSTGCILVGREFSPSGISLSKMAMDDLRKILPDTFTLTIIGD